MINFALAEMKDAETLRDWCMGQFSGIPTNMEFLRTGPCYTAVSYKEKPKGASLIRYKNRNILYLMRLAPNVIKLI